MFTDNPNRGKRRASAASRRTIRTSVPRSARTASGQPLTTGVTVYRVDPAYLRRNGSDAAVATCERSARGQRSARGAAVIARNVRRAELPSVIAARQERLAAERAAVIAVIAVREDRPSVIDRVLERAERAEARGNYSLAERLLEHAARLEGSAA